MFNICNPLLSKDLNNLIQNKNQLSRTWKISPKNIETEIKIGDIIKLGRVRLKFEKIHFKGLETLNDDNNNEINNNYYNALNVTSSFNTFINNTNNMNNNLNLNNTNNNNNNNNNNNITNINISLNESIENNNLNQNKIKISNSKQTNTTFNNLINPEVYCRICFSSYSDLDDPLITPCKCKGSMKYIHYRCLKQCIDTKLQKKIEESYKFFTWKNFECEICKSEYPKYLKYKNNYYNMIDLNNNYDNYAICDYNLYDDSKKKTFRKGILLIKIINKYDEITVGRTQTNKLKLKDISVSRIHCSIINKNNKLYVVDKGSKFGTLIYLRKKIFLKKNDEINLITGRHCFSINLVQNWSLFEKILKFNFNCFNCKNANDNGDIDVENLIKSYDTNLVNNKTSVNNSNNFNTNINNNLVLDESYEDYVLDIGTIIRSKEVENEEDDVVEKK